jgi:hypothetical protein
MAGRPRNRMDVVAQAQRQLLGLLSEREHRGLPTAIDQIDVDQERAAGLHAYVYFVDDPEPEFFSVPLAEMIVNFDHRRYRDAICAVAGF